MLKKTTLLFGCLGLMFNAFSQIDYEARIEFELKNAYVDEEVNNFGAEGFVLTSRNKENFGKENAWKYEYFDCDLNLLKTDSLMLNKRMELEHSYVTDSALHNFYLSKKDDFTIASYQVGGGEMSQVEGNFPRKTDISDMVICGDYAFLGGKIKKSSVLFSVNLKTGEKLVIPVNINKVSKRRITFDNIEVLPGSNEVMAYFNVYVKKREAHTYVMHLNGKGEKLDLFDLSDGLDVNLANITASKVNPNTFIFIGTYGDRSSVTIGTYGGMKINSEGMCFIKWSEGELISKKFFNFLDLDNFTSYLPERKQNRIERKKQRKKNRGKELTINYLIVGHELIQKDDTYLFLGEACYPTYSQRTRYVTTTANGQTTTRRITESVFDGFQYTHAILCKFNQNGELLWDNVFEMNSMYKPKRLKRFIAISETPENTVKLSFTNYDKMEVKAFDFNGKVLIDRVSEPIALNFDEDKAKRTKSSIDFWYDDYFIAYGEQKIKNKSDDKETKGKRRVYFINKVKF